MNKKEGNLQLELFSTGKEVAALNSGQLKSSFFSSLWSYEKTILIIIGFIVMGIVSFSFGVEKGKRISALKNNTYIDIALKTEQQKINKPVAPKPALEQRLPAILEENAISMQQDRQKMKNYTVQVASYKSKTSAKKEIESLKKNGLSPVILYKGEFVVVCVGNFPNKEKANSLLSELKKQKRYADSLIRRL